jgi:hypothetical protein
MSQGGTMGRFGFGLIILGFALAPLAAHGQTPVAVVEVADDARTDIMLMDILNQGKVIQLKSAEVLELGYMTSCMHEIITGGKVTIGEEQSKVQGGKVKRQDVDCDGGTLVATKGQKREAGAAVFRTGAKTKKLPKPDRTIYGLSPILRLSHPAPNLLVHRLDKKAADQTIKTSGPVVDFRKAKIVLTAGGLYRIEGSGRRVIVRVSAMAEKGVSVIARFVPF